jgi:hypothetical protein
MIGEQPTLTTLVDLSSTGAVKTVVPVVLPAQPLTIWLTIASIVASALLSAIQSVVALLHGV